MSDTADWAVGDATGLRIPAHGAALLDGGADWLTEAFRAMGALSPGNAVTAIASSRSFEGGGTGTKMVLALEYAREEEGLHRDLFVKFSRNQADPAMDAAKFHMEPEVRFAALSRAPDFPITVAPCLFADYEHASGTGLTITQAIPFGHGGIEPQYPKCLDHEMPEPLEHYRTLIATLARLAGSFRGGALPESVAQTFPWDHGKALAADRLRYTPEQLGRRVARYAAFAEAHPGLLPEAIRTPEFLASFGTGAALFQQNEDAIKQLLHGQGDFVSLCHWNANADNAWFWRGADGALHCGLLDWGSVGQLHLAMSLWGCLSGAQLWLWEEHLDELLALFASEYAAAGGPQVDLPELRLHLALYIATMGLCWLMDAPPRIAREVSDLAACLTPRDPRILASETARVQLQMLGNFLSLWQREDVTGTLQALFGKADRAARSAQRLTCPLGRTRAHCMRSVR